MFDASLVFWIVAQSAKLIYLIAKHTGNDDIQLYTSQPESWAIFVHTSSLDVGLVGILWREFFVLVLHASDASVFHTHWHDPGTRMIPWFGLDASVRYSCRIDICSSQIEEILHF